MTLPVLTSEDFAVFQIAGLENRMESLKRQIRPKFEIIGEQMSPFLTMLVQEPVSVHIAKHARRTVNPPEETWLAWSTNKRGYKAHPHFQFGLRDTYAFIWFALIYECQQKSSFARNLKSQFDQVWHQIPDTFYISQDHTKDEVIQKKEMNDEQVHKMLDRLEKVKKAEFLCGQVISRQEATQLNGEQLLKKIESTFQTVHPLYQLSFV
ncbi:YktB family protein [Hazenella coriacea]|uniref:UPF0637 protein EDD58_10376 n=1 Tax=Hazenella coriacea TaxID=1179467 RepID=A0A4R3L8X0_9BACL|nr:DUF1054 domain-containing protein [Hazenella coriacea]TCS94664.1 uncharacterized protein YktB (UPF0637 family) [Hazenella coriacea]